MARIDILDETMRNLAAGDEFASGTGAFRPASTRIHACYGRRVRLPFGPAACPLTLKQRNLLSLFTQGARVFELPVHAALSGEQGKEQTAQEFLFQLGRLRASFVLLTEALSLAPEGLDEEAVFVPNLSCARSDRADEFIAALASGSMADIQARINAELLAAAGAPPRAELPAAKAGTAPDGRAIPAFADPARREALARRLAALPADPFPVLGLSFADGLTVRQMEESAKRIMYGDDIPGKRGAFGVELKMSPALLGPERLNDIFLRAGMPHDQLDRVSASYGKNSALRYSELIGAIRRLSIVAIERGLFFGIRIDGSLPAAIGRAFLKPQADPFADGFFLSGRQAYLPAYAFANKLIQDLSGSIPVAFSGGLDAERASDLARAGIAPLAMATRLFDRDGLSECRRVAAALDRLPPDTRRGERDYRGRDRTPIDIRFAWDLGEKLFSRPVPQDWPVLKDRPDRTSSPFAGTSAASNQAAPPQAVSGIAAFTQAGAAP